MDGKGPQQANPNRIIDDPLAPLRLAPVAQISDFWKRYDRLADIHDKKLTSNLNGNLDVLLIFAALFSAIDTTFISITMPNLSPNSSDETNNLLRLLVMRADNNTLTFSDLSPPFSPASNSIVVNCLLYASLSCSLLAAVGAMMAKEWLQSFDRTGQTGPLEDQGRLRQGKLNGVERWHLEAVIKFLPNLLLLSVILFFTGIGLFLYPINVAVAGIIIAFSGFGGVFSIIVIVAGAITTTCPYQSAASGGLRRIIWALLESWRILLRSIVRPAASTASERLSKFLTDIGQRIRPLWNKTNSVGRTMRWWSALPSGPSNSDNSEGDQVVSRDSPETSSSLYVPQPSGRSSQSDKQAPHQLWRQARGASSFTRLQNTTSAIGDGREHTLTADAARWLLEATSNYGDQISTAQFICSLPRVTCTYIFEDPDSWNRLFNMTMRAFEIWSSQPNKDNQYVAELFGLVLCRVLLQCPKGDDKWNDITNQSLQEPNSFCTAFLRILEHASGQYSLQEPEDEECILHTVVLSAALGGGLDIREFQWAKLSRLLGSRSHLADPLFAVWTAIVWRISKTVQTGKITRLSLTEVIEQLDSRRLLARNLSSALNWSPECLQSVKGDSDSGFNAAEGFAICLQRARALSQQAPVLEWSAFVGLEDLIWSYLDPLTTSSSADRRLVRLSAEAVLTLQTFLPSPSGLFTSLPAPAGGTILTGDLIDSVVEIMMGDFTSPPGESWRLSPGSPSRSMRACIIRVLLWVWQNRSDTMDFFEYGGLFIPSCRLWAPLEKEVEFSKTGHFGSEDKPLTPRNLKMIGEFVEWVRAESRIWGWKTSAFISRNADVGINRLCAHLNRRADWEYCLYDLREQRASCSRSAYVEEWTL